ncbi:hypothetical protein DIPPA_30635 [Diplonema papillatum]|nr:hypothetical protein DIPPA_30635 [Diplonema papillatum]
MARGRAAPSGGGSRRQSPPPRHHSPPRAAPPARPPPPQAAHAPMAAQPQSGGMMGSIGSSIATGMSFGAGSAMGHMAINSMFGGGGGHGAPPAAAPPAPQEGAPPAYQQQAQASPCQQYDTAFHQCLETNNSDMAVCKNAVRGALPCASASTHECAHAGR